MNTLVSSQHFLRRVIQRHLSSQDIAFVLQHGQVLYRTGIQFCFLGQKDIPQRLRRDPHTSRLAGVTVLLAHDGTLITAYKNPTGLHKIKRKAKRYLPRRADRPLTYVGGSAVQHTEQHIS